MKKLIFIILFLICSLSYAKVRDELISLFYSANKLYEQGKYEEALGEYNKIQDVGFESGALYYNTGNCYFKLGLLGKTILFYERAKRLIPNDPELRFNYNYVQTLLQDKIGLPKKNWFTRNFLNISESLTFGKWLGFILILWVLLISSITINILTPKFRKIIKYLFIGFSTILIISIICAITQFNIYSSPSAIILSKEVPVRYGPGEAEVEAFMLHEGTKVIIKNAQENWYQIQLPDGKSGWLPKDNVEKI